MDDAQLSRSMSAYVEQLGEPDEATTSRLRERVTSFVQEHETRRRRLRRRLIALGGVAAIAAVAAGAWWVGAGSTPAPVLVGGGDGGQQIGLPGRGELALAAGSAIRFVDEPGQGTVEIVSGTVRVLAIGGEAAPIVVRSGGYEIQAEDAELELRHTGALPVVTVERGRALLSGPELPAPGLWLAPLDTPRN
jgi:ferric-dicitrate binding protein FerR (iron transport regulator)